MPELVFELGCEELPAGAVSRASHDLATNIETGLSEAGIKFGRHEVFATPRRLIVILSEVEIRQPDRQTANRGPAIASAFDASGTPTKALEGFCRGQGVSPDQVRKDGEYVWVDKVIAGRPTLEVLAEVLPAAVRSLTFDKTMRWGQSRMRFARPIRWIVAVFDNQMVSFDIEGVVSGTESRGHRFYAPQAFPVRGGQQFIADLRAHMVEPDAAIRRSMILTGNELVPAGCQVEWSDDLIDENVYLTEWPMPLLGSWSEDYLELPEPVLVTAMAKHERMFPIRAADGNLAPNFVWIRNSGEEETVRGGNEWVLNARFNDAKFFFDEDKKHNLDHFLGLTERMLFQEKLGTVRQRADRLAAFMVGQCGGDDARQTGLLAKADLTTGLVGELASLQGKVGGTYALREGVSPDICAAMSMQYLNPAEAEFPAGRAGELARGLIAADQFDKLAGYLGIGIIPSGSSDPMGLRRAATYVIELGFDGFLNDLSDGLNLALDGYAAQGVSVDRDGAHAAFGQLLVGRYQAMVTARYDLLAAAMIPSVLTQPGRLRSNLSILQEFATNPNHVETALRPIRIVNATMAKGKTDWTPLADIAEADLASTEGASLRQALLGSKATAADMQALCPAIHAFFESAMIMDENPKVQQARLSLAKGVSDYFGQIGDLTQIVLAN